MNDQSTHGLSNASIALVGLGNIGSQTAALLAGVETIGRVLLIDPDRYEASNLGSQRIGPVDVGRYKVEVQAKSLRRVAPQLVVATFAQPIESLPLGMLRGHVILACVDSRIARQAINRIAFALGTPWIDAALDRGGQVRSRIYLPGVGDCLECAWEREYDLLEQRVPCAATDVAGSGQQTNTTAAPQELGALAAGIQVSHLRSLLTRECDGASQPGRQWFYDMPSGRGWVGSYTTNPVCRLDHGQWKINELAHTASGISLSEALRLPGGDGKDSAIAVDGQMFVQRLRCAGCGSARATAGRLSSRIGSRACRKCGAAMTASAADVSDVLTVRNVPPRWLYLPLSAFGLLDSDVFSVQMQDTTYHYQLCGTSQEAR